MYRHAIRRALLFVLPVSALCLLLGTRQGVRAQESASAAHLGKQEVTAEIDDRRGLAVTTVRQELLNGSGDVAEVSCTLPIPDDAALLRFQVLGPPLKKGETAESRGRVEPAGRNQYRLVAHRVPRRGRSAVEVTYAEVLTRRGRRRKYVYPISSGGDAAPARNVHLRIEAQRAPERVSCTTHSVALRRPTPHVATLSHDSVGPPDGRDLVVDYELPATAEDRQARLSVLTPADRTQDPYFLLTLPPPAALLAESRALEQPADIVFCMDFSGSTRGRKLNAIQEAVHDGLVDLSPRDRFGVVAFDDDARAFRRGLAPAAPGAVAEAVRFVNRLRPGGGSDPERGLRTALEILGKRGNAAGRAAIIAVIVDKDDPARLAEAAAALRLSRRNIRLVALGALPDSRLVNYRIRNGELRSGPAIALSRAAVTYGPALAGAAFDAGALNASYIYPPPDRLPDLPLSTPIVLLGRLNQAPPQRGTVALAGKVEGKVRTLKVPYVWQALSPTSPAPALWANRRIRRLQQLAGRERGDEQELTDAVGRVRAEHRLAAAPQP